MDGTEATSRKSRKRLGFIDLSAFDVSGRNMKQKPFDTSTC